VFDELLATVCAPIEVAQRAMKNNPHTGTGYVFDIPRIDVPKKSECFNTTTMPYENFGDEQLRVRRCRKQGRGFCKTRLRAAMLLSVCRIRGETRRRYISEEFVCAIKR
jgi:hypothetical protein